MGHLDISCSNEERDGLCGVSEGLAALSVTAAGGRLEALTLETSRFDGKG
jgi:hypothetical protein